MEATDVLEFWLGPEPERDKPSADVQGAWWRKSDAFDEEISDRFAATITAVGDGQLDWGDSARGRLAMIIALDQFTRNTRRGTGRMYEYDPRALQFTGQALDVGQDAELRFAERYFLYMPLMHAEDLPAQERCCQQFLALGKDAPHLASAHGYAVQHRDIVARFGRFPHRNELLGRQSTVEEVEFLKQPGSSF